MAASDSAQEQAAPYGGGSAGPKRVRIRHFQQAKRDGVKITGLTSYDHLTAGIFDRAASARPSRSATSSRPASR